MKKLLILTAFALATSPLFAEDAAKVYLMTGTKTMAPSPAEGDPELAPVADGVYESTVSIDQGVMFGFYSQTGDVRTYYGPLYIYSLISFSEGLEWPAAGDDEEEGSFKVYDGLTNIGRWYVSNPPLDSNGTYTVTFDLNSMELSMVANLKEDVAPEALYLYGSVNGGITTSNMATLTPSEDNPSVFTLRYEVPKCEYTIDDPEYAPADGEPQNAFFFFLCDNKDSYTGNVKRYGAAMEDRVVVVEVGETYSVTLERNGSPLLDACPGLTDIVFDYTTGELSVTLVEQSVTPEPDPGPDTGIEVVEEAADYVWYDLQGRRVKHPEKGGLYVRVKK